MQNIRHTRVCVAVLLVLGMVLGSLGPNVLAMADKMNIGNGPDEMYKTSNTVVLTQKPTDPTGGFVTMADCSGFTGGTISANTTYTGGTCTVTTAITVQSGYTLRFEASATIIMSNYVNFVVSGTLEIVNSTVTTPSTSYYYQILPQSGSTIRLDNSTIRNFYYGIYAWSGSPRIEITKCNFVGTPSYSYYGIMVSNPTGWIMYTTISSVIYYPIYISSGSNFDIHHNTVTGSYYGVYLSSYSGGFHDNVAQGMTYYSYYIYYPSGTYYNNTGRSSMYGMYVYGGNAVFDNWKITGNTQYGIYAYDSTIAFYNSTITGNSAGDIYSYSWSTTTKGLRLVNCVFNTIASGTSMPVEVYWWTNFTVKWLSNSTPVEGADVTLFDNKGVQFDAAIHMDATGRMDWIPVMEYSQKGSAKTYKVPWAVNVTKKIGDKPYRNATFMNISQGFNQVDFILDDVAPWLSLTSPVPDSITNITNVTISGYTEEWNDTAFPITMVIQHPDGIVEPRVSTAGAFTVNLPLIIEGENMFTITVSDWIPNVYSYTFNMTRDTILPPLTITSPADKILTNVSQVTVSGSTEPGANLTINNEVIALDPDGSFSKVYDLKETWNEYYIKTEDKAGNYREATRSVQRDSIRPEVHIMSPSDGFKTGMNTVQIQGLTEPKAIVTMNGEFIPLAGSTFQSNVKLSPGENVITVIAHDAALNYAQDTIHIFYDDTAPELTVTTPLDGLKTNVERVVISGTVVGATSLTVEGQAVLMEGDAYSYTTTNLKEGRNTLTVTARDDVGNIVRLSRIVYLDTKAPSLSVESPFEGQTMNAVEVTVVGKTDDKLATLTVNGGSVSIVNMEFKATVSLEEGTNTVNLVIKDDVGNTNYLTLNIVRDMSVSLSLTSPVAEAGKEVTVKTDKEEYDISGRTDTDGTVMIGYNKANVDSSGRFSSKVSLKAGENRYTVKSTDMYGNTEYIDVLITMTPKGDGGNDDGGTSAGGLMDSKKPNYINFGLLFMLFILVLGLVAIGVDHRNRMKRWGTEKAIREGLGQADESQASEPVPAAVEDASQVADVAAEAAPAGAAVAAVGTEVAPGAPVNTDPRYAEAQDILSSIEAQIVEAEKEGDDMGIERKKLRIAKKFLEKGEVDNALFHAKKIIEGGD